MAQDMLTATLADMLRPETTRVARAFLSEYVAHWTPRRVERISCGGGSGGEGVANVCDGVRYCPNHAAADADDGVDLEALALVLGDRMADAIAGPVAENSVIPGMVSALENADERAIQAIELATERERAVIRRLAGALSSVESTSREVRAALDAAAESLGPAAARTAARLRASAKRDCGYCGGSGWAGSGRIDDPVTRCHACGAQRTSLRFEPAHPSGFFVAYLPCIVRAISIPPTELIVSVRVELFGPDGRVAASGIASPHDGTVRLDDGLRLNVGERCQVKTSPLIPMTTPIYLSVETRNA